MNASRKPLVAAQLNISGGGVKTGGMVRQAHQGETAKKAKNDALSPRNTSRKKTTQAARLTATKTRKGRARLAEGEPTVLRREADP